MKKIVASNDPTKYTQVDDDVFEIIKDMGLKFGINKGGYFQSTSHMIKLPGMTEKKRLLLHQFVYIIKTNEEPAISVDHIDINPANNQFENLRLASRQQQNRHRGKMKNNKSGYIGVCYYHHVYKYKNKTYENDYWYSSIQKPDGHTKVKYFPYTPQGKIAAGKWYDSKARDYFGEFAGQLNFPDDNQTA